MFPFGRKHGLYQIAGDEARLYQIHLLAFIEKKLVKNKAFLYHIARFMILVIRHMNCHCFKRIINMLIETIVDKSGKEMVYLLQSVLTSKTKEYTH